MLHTIDHHLSEKLPAQVLSTKQRFIMELGYFFLKCLRACLFGLLFFLAVFTVPRTGWLGIPRYDILLVIALGIQIWMVVQKIESVDELKAITLFHAIGFVLEAFKISGHIQSWSYPDFAYTKILGVPLFSGFMYAAVGSYMTQAWRFLNLKVVHYPPYWMTSTIAILIYLNFFTHHYIGDYRWYIAACALGLYARTQVIFTPYDRERKMPLLLAFILIGFFIWIAENISTFWGIWKYPHQMGAWSTVHVSKWSAWSLLVVMTFTIIAHLKHIKAHIHIARCEHPK